MRSWRAWLKGLGDSMHTRGLPAIGILDPPSLKKVLLEITAAMNGVATDSVGAPLSFCCVGQRALSRRRAH